MNLQLTPRIAVHQQNTPDNAFTDMSSVNGQTHITQHLPTLVDSDPEDDVLVDHEAQGKQQLADVVHQQHIAEGQLKFDSLTATEQMLSIERAFTPIIRKLTKQHAEACDHVTSFETTEIGFKAQICADYAYNGKHASVKKLMCGGDTHFQSMLRLGQLDIPGYKLVDKRSMGGLSFQLVFIPSDVPNLLHYAQCDEAKAIAQNEFDIQLQKLIRNRKAAALKLAQAKQQARDALSQVTSFEDLLSDGIKRGRK